ncbi:MAG: chromosomal replication initiator DnaA [Rhizobiales bacterium]|nr:chromosomal replication initiator DnaA [Hyphomicrobiales bacterium]
MASVRSPDQLALTLEHAVRFGREDFVEGPSNAAALALVEGWPDWPDRIVALIGPEGSGKTHLAAIWAAAAGATVVPASALAESELPALAARPLVLEDLAAGTFDERVMFHLLNLTRQNGAFLLLTARTPPAGWPITIKDLASRLRALPVVSLAAPDDALLRAVVVKLWADRQLNVDESLVSYVVTRIERSFAAARAAVVALDREALRLQRPVTRALAVDLLRGRDQFEMFGEANDVDRP